ncbi:MAG: hypothetical protein RLZZ243_392 [Bacteroidota bacterium]|jgi:hypothetical protein
MNGFLKYYLKVFHGSDTFSFFKDKNCLKS